MFLYIPALGLWTSHPFSAAWQSVKRPRSFQLEKSDNTVSTLVSGTKSERITVSFLIRKKDGFTKKMMRSIANGRQLNVVALAEGPYGMILFQYLLNLSPELAVLTEVGGVHSYDSYGTIVLIAGGIGITHPMSYLRELVNGFANRTVATRRITLLWVVRSVSMLPASSVPLLKM